MKDKTKTLLFMVATLVPVSGLAQQQSFAINTTASGVAFALTGSGHEVHGTFHVSSGSIQFDRSDSKIQGSVVVSAASGDSGDKGRDKNMRSQVLDVNHFADVTFEPKSYSGNLAATGDSSIQVLGIFTLHGVQHEITVPMQIHIDGGNLTAKGSFIVPYVQWGLKDPSVFILKVAKEVHIDLNLVGTVTPAN